MDWLPQCLVSDAGGFSLDGGVCFWGLAAKDILGIFGLTIFGILAAIWGVLKWLKGKTLPTNPDWPEVSNLTSQPGPDHLVKRRETAELAARIARAKGTVVQATVRGMAGVGKTTLALAVARQEQARFRGVWVIRAANEDTIRASLRDLAVRLKLPGADGPDREGTARAALDTVAQDKTPWLLVYDNADDPAIAKKYTPTEAAHVTQLFTSRSTDWPDWMTQHLGRMTRAEAVEMLADGLPTRDRAELARVAERLGDWPIALNAAVGYLGTNPSVTVGTYLDRFDITKRDMTKVDWSGSRNSYPDSAATDTIVAALRLTTDLLDPREAALLSVLCWIDPDDLWPEMVAEGVAAKIRDPLNGQALPDALQAAATEDGWTTEAMDRLALHSLVERDEDLWRMHRMIGEFWRATLEQRDDWRRAAAQIVNAETPYDAKSPANWDKYRRLMPQARALLEADADDSAAGRLFHQIGNYAYSFGVQPGDIAFVKASVANLEKQDPGSANHAASLNNLGMFQRQEGDLPAALATYTRVRDIRAALPQIGTAHPTYAITLNNIAGVYRARQEFAQAEPLLLDAQRIFTKALGSDHPFTINQDRNLGALYSEWAATVSPDQADPLRDKEKHHKGSALSASLVALGPMNGDVATDRNNAAIRLAQAGQLAEARDLMRQSAATYVDLLAAGHQWAQEALRDYLNYSIKSGDTPEDAIKALIAEVRAIRTAHRKWGAARLQELLARHDIAEGDFETQLTALNAATEAEKAQMRKDGAPEEAVQWVAQQFTEALHALTIDPEPGPDFKAKLQAAWKALQARAD